jgi:hypothetical protein
MEIDGFRWIIMDKIVTPNKHNINATGERETHKIRTSNLDVSS